MKVFIEANGVWPELFKFIAVGMDKTDLQKYIQTPLRLLERFQNCALLSMMNSKSVTDWINYTREFVFREPWEHSNLDLIARPIFVAVIECL